MIEKLGSLLMCLILATLGATLVLAIMDFLMGIGPIWALVGVGAGVLIWLKASDFES